MDQLNPTGIIDKGSLTVYSVCNDMVEKQA